MLYYPARVQISQMKNSHDGGLSEGKITGMSTETNRATRLCCGCRVHGDYQLSLEM